jgi:hypothetical protein
MSTDPLPAAAEPARLTAALRGVGALGDAHVSEVTVESARNTILSRIIRLRLSYEGNAPDAPQSLIFKTAMPERMTTPWNGGRREVAFYNEIAGATRLCLTPRCYDARWDADTSIWHLLLEDLSDTHMIATSWPIPPTMADCERMVAARARFHAAWWDDARLGTAIGTWADPDEPARKGFADQYARFADRLGDRLPPERRAVYEQLIAGWQHLSARYHSHRDMTILHGDAHIWNIFLPRDPSSNDVRFFDWDSWRLDVATDDLAYMIALHWYPDRRRRYERALLDRYHAELVAHGVAGYDRRALDDDYRLSVLWQITTPVGQADNNIPSVIWWSHLERIFLAVDDLGCREFLG